MAFWLIFTMFCAALRNHVFDGKSLTLFNLGYYKIKPAMINRKYFNVIIILCCISALLAGCDTLYSEDLQHGQLFGGTLRVLNPFV